MKVSQDMPSKENKCECVQKGDNREVFLKKIFIKQNGKINTESNDMGRLALHATFSCQRHDGVDLRKIIAYQPVGSHRLVGVSSRLRSPSHKSCNRAATALDANESPSSLEVLVGQIVDALQACLLWVGKNHSPNGITHAAQAIGRVPASCRTQSCP